MLVNLVDLFVLFLFFKKAKALPNNDEIFEFKDLV